MALTNTQLLDAIISAKGRYFGNFENRLSEYGALKAFIDNADKLLPASMLQSMKQSPVHATKIPMLNKFASELLTARACSVAANDNVSAFKALTWATKGFKVSITPAVNAGNYISEEDDFAQQFAMGLKTVFAALDTAAVAALETAKNTDLAASQLASQVNGAYEIKLANYDANEMYMFIPALMRLNDLQGPYIDIANSEEIAKMLKYRSLGENNAQNVAGLISGQLDGSGTYMSYLTNRLAAGTKRAVRYLAPEGSIGIYAWNDWESKNNVQMNEGDKKYTMQDPIFGITWGVHEKRTCVDHATFGSVYTTIYEFTADFAFASAYSSDNSSPIIKVTVPTSDNV